MPAISRIRTAIFGKFYIIRPFCRMKNELLEVCAQDVLQEPHLLSLGGSDQS
jgi:hypothetical protein